MALLSVGAGSWESMLSDWLKGPMTDLNPHRGSMLPVSINTAGSSPGMVDWGRQFGKTFFCIFFFFTFKKRNIHFYLAMFLLFVYLFLCIYVDFKQSTFLYVETYLANEADSDSWCSLFVFHNLYSYMFWCLEMMNHCKQQLVLNDGSVLVKCSI